jgi:hypothetical protein
MPKNTFIKHEFSHLLQFLLRKILDAPRITVPYGLIVTEYKNCSKRRKTQAVQIQIKKTFCAINLHFRPTTGVTTFLTICAKKCILIRKTIFIGYKHINDNSYLTSQKSFWIFYFEGRKIKLHSKII